MSRKKDKEAGDPAPPRVGLLVLAWRFLTTLLLLAIIFYAAALMLSRTEGFRTLVAERIEKVTGLDVKIGKSRCTLALDVRLADVKLSETGAVVRSSASCGTAVVVWHLPRPFGSGRPSEVSLDEVDVSMARHEGTWHPRAFADVAATVAAWIRLPLPPAEKPSSPRPARGPARASDDSWPAWTGPRVALSVANGRMTWWTEETVPAAEVTGLHLTVTPLDAPERPMMHYLVEASQVLEKGQPMAAPLRMEMLDAGDRQILLGLQAGQQAPASATR